MASLRRVITFKLMRVVTFKSRPHEGTCSFFFYSYLLPRFLSIKQVMKCCILPNSQPQNPTSQKIFSFWMMKAVIPYFIQRPFATKVATPVHHQMHQNKPKVIIMWIGWTKAAWGGGGNWKFQAVVAQSILFALVAPWRFIRCATLSKQEYLAKPFQFQRYCIAVKKRIQIWDRWDWFVTIAKGGGGVELE